MRVKTRSILILLTSAVVFATVSLPFTYLSDYYTISEVRPAAVLNPCIGFVFGPIGALGCAIGNFAVDYLTEGIRVAVIGFVPQIVYGLIPWLMLQYIYRDDDNKKYYRFTKARDILFLIGTIVISSIVIGVTVSLIFGTKETYLSFIWFIVANNISMNFIFAVPLTLLLVRIKRRLYCEEGKKAETINENLILFFMLIECATLCLISVIMWYMANRYVSGLELWMTIFNCDVVTVVFFAIVQVFFINHIEKKITEPIKTLAKVWKKDRNLALEVCNRLYSNKTEIGELSRTYLELVDEIQRNVIHSSTEETETSGILLQGVTDNIAKVTFAGSLEEQDVSILESILTGIGDVEKLEIDTERMSFMTSKILQTLSDYIEIHKKTKISMKNASDGTKLILEITGFNSFISVE